MALHIGLARFTYGVMLPALKRDLALDYFGGGLLNAVHLLGYLAGTLAAPLLARRVGMAALSRGAHALVAAGALACAVVPEASALGLPLLALGRIATGLGAGAAIVAILVITFAAVPMASRSSASALVWSGMGFAVVVSGAAAGVLVETAFGWRAAFLVAAALAALLAFVFPPAGTADEGGATAPVRLRSPGLFLVAAYLMFGAAYIAYATFAGTRLAAAGASIAAVSAMWITFGTAMIAGSALSFAVLRLEGRRRLALFAALLLGALGSWASWTEFPGAALAGALLVGAGLSSTPTIVTAYVRERCSAEEYPQAFSFATAVMGIGQLLGPLAAGALADRLGVEAVALFAAAVYGLGAALAAVDRR
ncbi:MAG: YbfB/YjiJ family MFS transporter [Betaproteobacteria bacterium]|nr:MAG: YbfB/YjiJ family MFS transporter [Betaproteobacteria bacterium]